MKKIAKWIIPLVLVIALIASAVWYMFVYDRDTVQDFLVAMARNCAEDGNFEGATWFYDLSYQLSEEDQNVAIELSQIYKDAGNYTKAEYTLANAIADGGSAELYTALCKTYVEQDKLLDAVNLLDNIADPTLKAELDALRPAAPQTDIEPGFYNQYITLNFQHDGAVLYVTTTGEYPSTEEAPCTEAITLSGGETKIYAISVGENGLVSPVAIFNYTIGGVIEPAVLSDPAIEALIRQTLMFGSDTVIYTSDLWTIEEFTVPSDATDLSDLAGLTHLKKLTIENQDIPSLGFLSGMSSLEELNISGCRVSEGMNVIGTLPSLKKLTLSGCGLSTIADLANAQMLTELDLSNNAIGDVSVLAAMTALAKLDLSENAVTDLSALAGLPQLSALDLSHNAVSSIVPLTSCAGMTELDVSYNTLTDISAVKNMTGLVSLSAAHNSISSVDTLSACTELAYLDISNNAVTDLSALAGLVKIAELNFSYNSVAAMPDLPENCALTVVNGEHNVLTDVSPLGGMENLNYVYLDYNEELADISFLANCTQLVQVNVYGTAVLTDSVNALIDRSIIVNFDPT